MKEVDFKNLNFSLFGKQSELEGEFKLSGDTIINCYVKGTITIINDGQLTLEREALVEGSIYCENIEVFGEVRGTIRASGTLIIRSSANVSGNISAKQMSVYPGAQMNIEGHTLDEAQETPSEHTV